MHHNFIILDAIPLRSQQKAHLSNQKSVGVEMDIAVCYKPPPPYIYIGGRWLITQTDSSSHTVVWGGGGLKIQEASYNKKTSTNNSGSEIHTVKPVLKRPCLAKKKWSLNRGGLLKKVKIHCKATIGT